MKKTITIARKELESFFGSPIALIFLTIFLVVTLFVFFWVAGFFARGIADIRPLFRWMPLTLIFLVAALTMRQWSEEQRSGTIEMLMTLPLAPWQVVLGKFLAVMALVGVALLLTLPIPAVVAMLGPLDWGPVIGGYLAALLLAAAYAALGQWLSALTDSPIVALLATAVIGGLLYLLGTPVVTGLTGAPWNDVLRATGTGSRFESIERGVIDLRDLLYYLSLGAFFLLLTVYTLDRKRWGSGAATQHYRRNASTGMALLGANLLVLNLWLAPLAGLRWDATAQQEYTLSQTTKELIGSLQEPLLIRAYISSKSHPLLDPLRPQVEDLLREYAIAGKGRVTAEVVDPAQDPALEAEANQTYGIQPTPFQVSDRYQASVINAYFDILVRYGDQDLVLNFRDLIQVEQSPEGGVDVRLRNPEYDLTSAIKKVLYGFQSIDTVLASQTQPLKLTLYTTPHTLPPELAGAPETIRKVADDLAQKSGGKLLFAQVDPTAQASDANGGQVTPQVLAQQYGIQPIPASLFGNDSFYLHMVLEPGTAPGAGSNLAQVIYPQNDMSEAAVREAIQAAALRTSTGFLKVVGLWTPPPPPQQDVFGQVQPPVESYSLLRQQLSQEYSVRDVDLADGLPPAGIDVLLLLGPQNLTDKQRFAIDQFLMRGGSVVVLAGNYAVTQDPASGQLALKPLEGTLGEQLRHYGVEVPQTLVLDAQNQPFPTQVTRNAGGIQVQEVQALNYPFFVDVRQSGMDGQAGITSNLANVALYWTSPVVITGTNVVRTNSPASVQTSTPAVTGAPITGTTLLQSSANTWLSSEPNIQPDFQRFPNGGFEIGGPLGVQPLAVSLQGAFGSYFAGKPNPLAAAAPPAQGADGGAPITAATVVTGSAPIVTPLLQAADSARLVVVGSSEFVDDAVLQMVSSLAGDQVLNNVQFVQNAVDWAAEDTDLLSLRSRGPATHLLEPLGEMQQQFWELLTYFLVLAGLVAAGATVYAWRRRERPMPLSERDAYVKASIIG